MPTKKTSKTTTASKKAAPASVKGKPMASLVPDKPKDPTKFSLPPRILLDEKAKLKKGEAIEDLITERKIELKSVEEFLGMQQKQDYRNKPIIKGVYDLLIPPGTPRKLIIKLAREYPITIVRRDDIYAPIGVSDVERDLLAIRGDKRTIRKMEKLLFEAIADYIGGSDARLHDYSKPVKLEGIGLREAPVQAASAKAKPKPKAKPKAAVKVVKGKPKAKPKTKAKK
jgi:hypothetical protein